MKYFMIFIPIWFLIISACSDDPSKSSHQISEAEKKAFIKEHDEITQNSILATFINDISDKKYDKAILLLHPKFKDAWTDARFAKDWKDIREQLSENWAPEATGSFSGISEQGPYQQATYRLVTDWRSLSSIDLFSMKNNGTETIVGIYIRVPYADNPPSKVTETVENFVQFMFEDKYEQIEGLMNKSCKQQFPDQSVKQLRPILGKNESELEMRYYRMCANTVWYDAVRLNAKGDSFTFLELILSLENNESKIMTLTFRGQMK